MPFKFIVTLTLLLAFAPLPAFCQTDEVTSSIFCDKKWYCEMTKDANGTLYPTPDSNANNFMNFRCDSTFTLVENQTTLEGRWEFDSNTMTISMHQSQMTNIPELFSFHIIDYDEGHLVIIGRQGTDNEETAHLFTK
jgi:hypothetical protein